jgi:hypothetical protein
MWLSSVLVSAKVHPEICTVTQCGSLFKTLTVKEKNLNSMVRLWHLFQHCMVDNIVEDEDTSSGIYRRLNWRHLWSQWHLWGTDTTSVKSSTQRQPSSRQLKHGAAICRKKWKVLVWNGEPLWVHSEYLMRVNTAGGISVACQTCRAPGGGV